MGREEKRNSFSSLQLVAAGGGEGEGKKCSNISVSFEKRGSPGQG